MSFTSLPFLAFLAALLVGWCDARRSRGLAVWVALVLALAGLAFQRRDL